MTLNEKLPIAKSLKLTVGNRNDNPPQWTTFAWDDPLHGHQEKGEVVVMRPEGTSGTLASGTWRTVAQAAGCRPDGSCTVVYSAPLGDETMFILEGNVEITITKTGRKHRVQAGSMISHPKNLDVTWEISGPFLKKMWVIWDSPNANAHQFDDMIIRSSNDLVDGWIPFEWDEPVHGPSKEGEIFVLRDKGATGTLMAGLWRTGLTSPVKRADGGCQVKYSSPLGDETFLLLEGAATLTVMQTGEQYHIKAGDIVGHPKNLDVLWDIKTPFLKKYWVITDAESPR